jgi:hypothetical protein
MEIKIVVEAVAVAKKHYYLAFDLFSYGFIKHV